MTTPQTGPAESGPPRRRRTFRRIVVTRVEQLSPRMVRVAFTGDDLAAFGWNGPAAHVKLVFPQPGQSEPVMPDPDGPRPSPMRTYTPRRFDAGVPELEIEFVLHGEGPASGWASQAQVGQALVLAGPGPNYVVDPDAPWYVLAGDDTALPAISSILDALPASTRALVLLEVADAQEQRPLHSAAQLDIQWVYRSGEAGAALEQALRGVALPEGAGRIYVGCESGAMRRIRGHLLGERGLEPARVVTRGYWKRGAVDYTDRDYGTD